MCTLPKKDSPANPRPEVIDQAHLQESVHAQIMRIVAGAFGPMLRLLPDDHALVFNRRE